MCKRKRVNTIPIATVCPTFLYFFLLNLFSHNLSLYLHSLSHLNVSCKDYVLYTRETWTWVSEHQGQLYWSQIREPAPQPPTDYEPGAPATEEARCHWSQNWGVGTPGLDLSCRQELCWRRWPLTLITLHFHLTVIWFSLVQCQEESLHHAPYRESSWLCTYLFDFSFSFFSWITLISVPIL